MEQINYSEFITIQRGRNIQAQKNRIKNHEESIPVKEHNILELTPTKFQDEDKYMTPEDNSENHFLNINRVNNDQVQETHNNMLEPGPTPETMDNIRAHKQKLWSYYPRYTDTPMFSLTPLESGIGNLEFTIVSNTPLRLTTIIEKSNGDQCFHPFDNLVYSGVSLSSSQVTINLRYIKEIKRMTIVSLDNSNGGVLTINGEETMWKKTQQLNTIKPNTVIAQLYNSFGKIVIRESCYSYPTLRELAIANSYEKITWLDDNRPYIN